MEKIIGIIAAMDEEINVISNLMEEKLEKEIYNLKFIIGNINNWKCIIVKSGVGKVNAARTTQILIDNFKEIDFIINVGTAGSVNDEIDIGDIIIGTKIVNHDFDITAFGHEKGYITDVGKEFISDNYLTDVLTKAKDKINNNEFKIIKGIIATGDIFCTDVKMKEKIRKKFNADCVEMEAAAIAQVCTLDKVPFVVIRAISDKPNGNNQMEFNKFIKLASSRYAMLINNI